MGKRPVEQEIRNLLKAKYPMIYIVSYEESRVIHTLKQLCMEQEIDLYTWSLTEGIIQQNVEVVKTTAADPMEVLNKIQAQKTDAAFVLKDFHPFVTEADVVRKIRDLQSEEADIYRPIIVLSPVQRIPVELEKTVTILDYDLPETKDIQEIVDAAIEELHQVHEFSMPEKEREVVIKACQGLTVDEIENILAKSWVEKGTLSIDIILTEKKQIIRKSGILEYYDNLEEFANVGGMPNLKEWLRKRSVAFTDAAKSFGLPDPKGLLILGIPGTGKSLICKAVAGLWKVPLIRMDVGRIMSGLVGSSEENMRKALRTCEAISPCIMWVDEIEKGLSGTGSSNMSDGGTINRIFGMFIQWLQDKTAPVFVIATANNVKELPPELLRKGRFDDIFFVDLPSHEEREEIFKIHLQKRGRDSDRFDLDALALRTNEFSGAEIEQSIIAAMFNVFVDDAGTVDITTQSIEGAIKEIIPISVTSSEQIDAMREWARTRARIASSHSSFVDMHKKKIRKLFNEE